MALTAPRPEDLRIQQAIVMRAADADVVKLLRQAQADIVRMLNEVVRRPAGIGRDVREAQLRLVQRNLHLEMAKVWRALGKITEARRSEAAARAIDHNRKLDLLKLTAAGLPGGADIANAIAESELANAASGMDRMIARLTGAAYVPLSQRVYNSEVRIGQQIDRMVNSALARGLSAKEFANEVKGFIDPTTPGGVRYAALRLARTEINNAAHAMAVEAVRDKPWITHMDWHLSGSHPKPDICDVLHREGPYPKDRVPAKPHPHCFCYVTASLDESEEAEDEFLDALLDGKYDQYLDKYRNLEPGQVVRTSFGSGGGFPSPPPPKKAVRAKSPSRARPPAPGAEPAKHPPEQIKLAKDILGFGGNDAVAEQALRDNFGLKPSKAKEVVAAAKKDLPGGTAPPKSLPKPPPVKPEGRRSPRVPSPRTSPEAISEREGMMLGKLHFEDEAQKAKLFEELRRQDGLTPSAMDKLGSVSIGTDEERNRVAEDGDAMAWYHAGGFEIKLHEICFDHKFETEVWPKGRNSNWTSRTPDGITMAQSTLAHEFGHHVAEVMRDAGLEDEFWDEVAKAMGTPALGLFDDPDQWLARNRMLVANTVSRYGATSAEEMLAEVWREYSTMGAKARPIIRKIGALMQRLSEQGEL